ncbi:MAG: hypothetical protein H6Q15_2142 [Bacteroidetes bacterium]|nr:hypothetical protein [Bacteroidota bacterium]
MKNVLKAILGILFLCTCCCISCKKHNENSIESIYVLYYNYTFDPIVPIICSDMKKNIPPMTESKIFNERGDSVGTIVNNRGILDTTLTDLSLLENIAIELKNLRPNDSIMFDADARISCTIKYRSGKKERLCIGGVLADCIDYCGIPQNKNNRLLYLIKSSIGYYSWIGDKELKSFDELHDCSFKRDSVVGHSGRKF